MTARKATGIRLSVEEQDALRTKATACGMTMSAWCRQVSLGAVPRSLWDARAVAQLRALGHNINQLARLAHLGQLPVDAAEELKKIRASLDLVMAVLW